MPAATVTPVGDWVGALPLILTGPLKADIADVPQEFFAETAAKHRSPAWTSLMVLTGVVTPIFENVSVPDESHLIVISKLDASLGISR